MKIHIQTQNNDYARKELTELLSRCTNALFTDDGSFDRQIVVTVDPALQPHCRTIRGDGKTLRIAGGSDSAALCGVYDALRAGGLRFHANGNFCVGRFDFDAFFSQNRDVHPKLMRRGIRQHINFTMDISSYPLSEAKEYIRNLARMRFNAITFHSYGGQWHSEHPDTGYAAELALAYARHYSALLPDRGGEGQLVSYLNTIPVYIEKEKQYYLGVAEAAAEKAFDAPPPPLTEV